MVKSLNLCAYGLLIKTIWNSCTDLQPGEYTFLIGVSDRASTLGEISETPGQNTLSYLFEGNVDAEVQLRAIGRAEG